ncbi:MAG: hypothetical protein WC556_11425 [Candidatus Methanoperedens sp.]
MQNLIAYFKIENKSFVRCENKKCQKNVDKGYIDVSILNLTKKCPLIKIILPCCKSEAMIQSVRFLPINRQTPKKMRGVI